jgi:hypothetical protein
MYLGYKWIFRNDTKTAQDSRLYLRTIEDKRIIRQKLHRGRVFQDYVQV